MNSKSTNQLSTILLLAIITVMPSTKVRAELDPDLAATQTKNPKSIFLGGNIGLGQSYPTEKGSPGLSFKTTAEFGFMLPRGNWDRIELSGELGILQSDFKYGSGSQVESYKARSNFLAMLRFGYGYSIGYDTFVIARVGIGPTLTSLSGTLPGNQSVETTGSSVGLLASVGADIVSALNDHLDLCGGVHLERHQFDVDQLKAGGTTLTVNESVQVNMPMVRVGIRANL